MPHFPEALPDVVKKIDRVSGLHPSIRIVAVSDHSLRDAVNFPRQRLHAFSFLDPANNALPLRTVKQRRVGARHPFAIGAALERTRSLIDVHPGRFSLASRFPPPLRT